MYRQPHFVWDDSASLIAFCRAHSFATVVTTGEHGPEAQHIPLLVERVGHYLVMRGHAALGNPLWQATHALAIFSGPHAYVSAAWYDADDTVPTWNYLAVHARGSLRVLTDGDEVRSCFAQLGAADPQQAAWAERLSEPMYQRLAGAIRWFRIDAVEITGKAKLSQNHATERRQRVIDRLTTSSDQAARDTATAMARSLAGQPPWPATEES